MTIHSDKKLAVIGYYIDCLNAELLCDLPNEDNIYKYIKKIKALSREQYSSYLQKRKDAGF